MRKCCRPLLFYSQVVPASPYRWMSRPYMKVHMVQQYVTTSSTQRQGKTCLNNFSLVGQLRSTNSHQLQTVCEPVHPIFTASCRVFRPTLSTEVNGNRTPDQSALLNLRFIHALILMATKPGVTSHFGRRSALSTYRHTHCYRLHLY
ncbi:hypothetical protein J6590_033978 [Homalodisca vitripennis]|nr:hypothetical protein J6590_033978 [Homalodisca vitripennis]